MANGAGGPPPLPAMVGRAPVVARPAEPDGYAGPNGTYPQGFPIDPPAAGARVGRQRGGMRSLRRGSGWTVAGASFAVLCWLVWAAAHRSSGAALVPGYLVATAAVAFGVFVVLRLLGRLVIEGWMHKRRRGAYGAHLGTAAFLVAVGVTYLQDTAWILDAYRWMRGL